MEYHPSFAPSCPETQTSMPPKPVQAVTFGAGIQWYQAYAFAEKNNVTVVGGKQVSVNVTS